ncbi:MAG: histidinol-phosphatase HisJ family protein [Defluviitaleaceae bacterium]|nr:histidinol-phosphatase HisJ family protein [Defluviitaleaceae bacterium]
MIKFDYHTHTNYSFDGLATIDQMIQKAIDIGLEEYAITDHIDFSYPDQRILSPKGVAANVKAAEQAREKYANKIKILVGVELGLRPDLAEAGAKIAESYDFDVIIGSMHEIKGIDFYYPDLHRSRTRHEVFTLYFENMLSTVQVCDCFDVLGHIGYVERYVERHIPGDYAPLKYMDYVDIIDEILKTIIGKGKGIEINTSGYAYGLGRTHPQVDIVRRYRQLGGEIITVGSDTHHPDNVGGNFDKAQAVLEEAGFAHITRFRNRKPEFIKF